MKILYTLFLIALLTPALTSQAQNSVPGSGGSKSIIEYQWPTSEETYVPQKATLIVRPSKALMSNHSGSDFMFIVKGSASGLHTGKVIISDDEQTVIFKPDQPFALNEKVTVNLEISRAEEFTPLTFSFQTTNLSEIDQRRILYQFHQNDQAEGQSIPESAPAMPDAVNPPRGGISIFDLPLVPVIDTVSNTAPGNIFFTCTKALPSPTSYIACIDDTGGIIVNTDIPLGCGNFKMEFDGTFTFFRESSSPAAGVFFGRYEHLNTHLQLIDTFQCGNGFIADLHDFHLMKNGHAMMVAYAPRIGFDMTQVPGAPACAKTKDTVIDAVIQELDQDKNVVFQWNTKDNVLITDAASDINLCGTTIDYCHINAAEIDSSDGNIITSFRHLDEVIKINRQTGEMIWRWGGKHNMFTFSGPNPGDTLKFSHQHDPSRIPNGHITLWDNGNLRPVDTIIGGEHTTVNKPFSRAVEYALDETNHTATVAWDFRNLPISTAAGSVQRLANGNTIMATGLISVPSPVYGSPSILEVSPTNEVVFSLTFPSNSFVYRAYRSVANINSVRETGPANTFALTNIYPNPAQNATTIAFSVKNPGLMQIELLDILGHTVRSLSEKLSGAGAYSADLDLHDLTAGTYYCKLSQGGNAITKMVVIQK